MLVTEWKKRTVLPTPQTTPPLTPQKSSKQQTSSQAKPQVHSVSNTSKASPAIKASKAIPQAGSSQRTAASIALPSAHLSSDMDIDVEGGQSENEGEGDGDDVPSNVVRDAEGDEIVRQLERGLPRWEGFGGKGWIEDLKFVSFYHEKAILCSHVCKGATFGNCTSNQKLQRYHVRCTGVYLTISLN